MDLGLSLWLISLNLKCPCWEGRLKSSWPSCPFHGELFSPPNQAKHWRRKKILEVLVNTRPWLWDVLPLLLSSVPLTPDALTTVQEVQQEPLCLFFPTAQSVPCLLLPLARNLSQAPFSSPRPAITEQQPQVSQPWKETRSHRVSACKVHF